MFALTDVGEAFWLDSRTIAHVVTNEQTKVQDIYTISILFDAGSELVTNSPSLIGSIPTTTSTNFRYIPGSDYLVFSDSVYEDGDLKNVKDNDKAWDDRGTTAFVYDETYVRHWDTWGGPKHSSLFSVRLSQDEGGNWTLGNDFVNVLNGTKHVNLFDLVSIVVTDRCIEECTG
jgi:hypothetical protein